MTTNHDLIWDELVKVAEYLRSKEYVTEKEKRELLAEINLVVEHIVKVKEVK